MADEEQFDPEIELAALNTERKLMEQLEQSLGWNTLVQLILNDIRLSQASRDSAFLTIAFGEQKLDGIQSLVYEGFVKGLHVGLKRATEIPQRIITNNRDMARILEQKISMSKENENGSGTNGSGDDDGYEQSDDDAFTGSGIHDPAYRSP